MRIAAVHQFTSSKFLGGKFERQPIEKRYSPFVPMVDLAGLGKLTDIHRAPDVKKPRPKVGAGLTKEHLLPANWRDLAWPD